MDSPNNYPKKLVLKIGNQTTQISTDNNPKTVPKIKLNMGQIRAPITKETLIGKNAHQPSSSVNGATCPPKKPVNSRQQKIATMFFEWLLRQHERKDPHKIFLEEVTDQIAPGYSRVIKTSMCFEKIRGKIQRKCYGNISQLRADFFLTFENCILYNTPDTIYHSFGRKMLTFSKKLMAQSKIVALTKELPFLKIGLKKTELEAILDFELENYVEVDVQDLPEEQAQSQTQAQKAKNDMTDIDHLDEIFDDMVSTDEDIDQVNREMGQPYEIEVENLGENASESKTKKKPGRKPKNASAAPTNLATSSNLEPASEVLENPKPKETPEDIANNAKEMARLAREKLAKLRPGSTMGFLKRKNDGSIAYNVLIDSQIEMAKKRKYPQPLAPDRPRGPQKFREMKLIDTIGEIRPGCGRPTLPLGKSLSTTPMISKKLEQVTPIDYIDYGPFGSFSPVLNNQMYEKYSPEEMSILRAAYETPTGALYAESATNFVKDSASWVTDHVDRILDSYTGKKHTTYKEYVEHQRKVREKVESDLKISSGQEKCPEKVSQEKLDSLRSLADLGIDVSFLDPPKSSQSTTSPGKLIQKVGGKKGSSKKSPDVSTPKERFNLDDTAGDLKKLKKMQDKRLGHSGRHYGTKEHLVPSENEFKMVKKLENNFTKMIGKNTAPKNLVDQASVRNSLNVVVKPLP